MIHLSVYDFDRRHLTLEAQEMGKRRPPSDSAAPKEVKASPEYQNRVTELDRLAFDVKKSAISACKAHCL